MVKLSNQVKKRSKKALNLKKLSEQVPQSQYQKHQEEELKLFEDEVEEQESIKQEPKQEEKIDYEINQNERLWEDEHDDAIQIDLSKVARLRKLIKNGKTLVSGKEYQNQLREYYKSQKQNEFLSWAQQKEQIKEAKVQYQTANLKELLSQNISNNPISTGILQSKIIKVEYAGIVKGSIDTVIQTITFHSKLPIFAVGGFDKMIRIYQFNPNKQIQLVKSIGLDKFPICKLQFMNNSNIILAASPFKTYLIEIDINAQKFKRIRSTLYAKHFNSSGKYNRQIEFRISDDDKHIALYNESGYIHILDGQSKVLINEFKQNEACKAVTFADGYLISAGQGGKIYQWSLQKQQIQHVFHNPGGFEVNCLDFNIDLLAVGCKTGIVNIFKFNKHTQQFNKDPVKEVQNLTTSVDQVQFNKFGEILFVSSKWKDTALKLVHVDSFTVFENWPNFNTHLKKISALGVSNDSRFLVIGNEDGELRAFRLLNY